jgi:hypothetical protein
MAGMHLGGGLAGLFLVCLAFGASGFRIGPGMMARGACRCVFTLVVALGDPGCCWWRRPGAFLAWRAGGWRPGWSRVLANLGFAAADRHDHGHGWLIGGAGGGREFSRAAFADPCALARHGYNPGRFICRQPEGPIMPKRTDIKSILIIGAGPIVIGQACEFDYSGAQACKALREEGYRVILVNSNPATIMTDPEMADATYIEPITPEIVEKIIAKERPDALLPTMGGQTGLNTALALADMGVLNRYGVELIGAQRAAIEMAEDRKLFREAMDRIGLENPRATIVAAPKHPNGKYDIAAGHGHRA